MELDNGHYRLKAMNCPMHNEIYRSRGRSYPWSCRCVSSSSAPCTVTRSPASAGPDPCAHDYSGRLTSYVTKEQAPDEVRHLLKFMLSLLEDFGMTDFYLELSTRDTEGDKKDSSSVLMSSGRRLPRFWSRLRETGLELVPDPGGAAFYGPKISVQAKDAIGRTWQMSTVQYDFNQPKPFRSGVPGCGRHRAGTGHDSSAKFGSIERFLGVLTEHYAGAFPAWSRRSR